MDAWSKCDHEILEPRMKEEKLTRTLSDLSQALSESEILRKKQSAWPPSNKGHDPSGRGLAGVMDDEMGFVD